MEMVHDRGEPLVQFPHPLTALKYREIEPCIEIEEPTPELEPAAAGRIGEQGHRAVITPGANSAFERSRIRLN